MGLHSRDKCLCGPVTLAVRLSCLFLGVRVKVKKQVRKEHGFFV